MLIIKNTQWFVTSNLFVLFVMMLTGPSARANDIRVNTVVMKHYHDVRIEHWHHRTGDDSTWSAFDLELSAWQYFTSEQTKDEFDPEIQWYRASIELQGEQDEFDVLALSFDDMFSAFQVWWDGHLLGSNGHVGNSRETEIPGPVEKTFRINRQLTAPGRHVLAIRISNFHFKRHQPLGRVSLGYHYSKIYTYSYKGSHFLFKAGALLVSGFICIAFFFAGGRHRSFLFFAVFSFTSLFLDVYPTLQLFSDITAGQSAWFNWLSQYGRLTSLLFLAVFYLYTFDLPRKKLLLPAALLLFIISIAGKGYLYPNQYELLPLFSMGLLLYVIMHKKPGAIPALLGLVFWRLAEHIFFMPNYIQNHLIVYILGEMVLLFSIFLAISRDIHNREVMLQEIKLRSLRLEADLLKKHIQPHFILNTLQSITNWISKKPDNAQKLIEALAEEFKMINQISDKRLIPVQQEIELCNTHLKIMGFRMGTEYELVTTGSFEHKLVPPMVFHTLIENALTHAFRTHEAGKIHLDCSQKGHKTVYCMSNNGSRLSSIAGKSRTEIQEGMGIKYIKMRLDESFPGKWHLDYQLTAEQWLVTISIQDS